MPPGFAVSTSAFRAFVEEAGLGGHDRRRDVAHVAGRRRLRRRRVARDQRGDALRAGPGRGARRGRAAVRRARGEAGVAEPPVAVRSSALGEDSQDATFAGQQETYLWVRGADHVCDAVRDCWVSLYSPPAISYRARLGDGEEPAMGVAVQLMVDAEVSGVLFTCNPVSGDPSMVAVNASWGLGLAVVGGEVTPDDYLVSKVTREVVREHVHSKDVAVRAGRRRARRRPGGGARGAAGDRVPRRRGARRARGRRRPHRAVLRLAPGRRVGDRAGTASCPRASSSSSRARSPRCSGRAARRLRRRRWRS